MLLLQVTTGTWKAYFLVQTKYNYDATWPWIAIWRHASQLALPQSSFTEVQTTYVAVLALLLLVAAARAQRKAVHGLLALFLLVYWWVPLSLGGSLSLYRAESMLLVAVPLARKLPIAILLVLVVVAFVIAARMDVLYFRNGLV